MDNLISQKIAEVISPFVGSILAESIIKVQCDRLKIKPQDLTIVDLPRISDMFSSHINIFVGAEKAREIGNRLKMIRI